MCTLFFSLCFVLVYRSLPTKSLHKWKHCALKCSKRIWVRNSQETAKLGLQRITPWCRKHGEKHGIHRQTMASLSFSCPGKAWEYFSGHISRAWDSRETMGHHLLVILNSMENHGKHGTAFSHDCRQHGEHGNSLFS